MVEEYELLRQDLQVEVFTPYGKSVTFIKKSLPIYNSRGEEEDSTETSSTVTVVPYNIINQRTTHEAFGELKDGEMDLAVPYTVNVEKLDEFIIETETWVVREVEKNFLPENVVTICRITRKHNVTV
jgi:hypothetical protein